MLSRLLAVALCLAAPVEDLNISLPDRVLDPLPKVRMQTSLERELKAGDELPPLYISQVGIDAFFTQSEYEGHPELRLLRILHRNFKGHSQYGEIVCNSVVAEDVLEIFRELYDAGYRIESVRLADEWDGDDEAIMSANNTSSFNERFVKGTRMRSKHSEGLAIDVNPLYNPCVRASGVQPAAGREYADRHHDMEHKINHDDLCYKLFRRHGWFWGGDWRNVKDYQHFEYHIKHNSR